MPTRALIEGHVAVTELPDAGKKTFTNTNPPWQPPEGVRAIFGGFLLGQSVSAATSTVDSTFSVFSVQASFLHAGNAREKIIYEVENVASSRTFTTRHVRALQGGRCIYMAIIAYQTRQKVNGSVLSYGPQMPKSDGISPEDPDLSDNATKMMLQLGHTQEMITYDLQDPFDWRPFSWSTSQGNPSHFRFRSFVRSPPLSTDDAGVHASSLAFLTDEWFLAIPQLAVSNLVDTSQGYFPVHSSMNHSIRFHSPFAKADEMMLCERETSWADHGRVLVEQKMWSLETGQLVLSCSQEGLFRVVSLSPNL